MNNRILIIGDELFGADGEAAARFSELVLCENPTMPVQFAIYAPVKLSLGALLLRAPSDIIGKQAGKIVLGAGLRELRTQMDADSAFAAYEALVRELVNKTEALLYPVTIPPEALPEWTSEVRKFNGRVLSLADPARVFPVDFAAYVGNFNKKQLERGKFARSLFGESGAPGPLCFMLLGICLREFIFKVKEKV